MALLASKLLCCVFISGLIVAETGFSGPGEWFLINTRDCKDPEQYPTKFEITRKKFTRSQESLNLNLLIDADITEDADMRMDFCIYVDGGCKFMMTKDGKFCAFCREFFGTDFMNAMKGIGLDPPDCPVPKGHYNVNDIILDYEQLPPSTLYGKFDAVLYMMSGGKDTACLTFTYEFKQKEE